MAEDVGLTWLFLSPQTESAEDLIAVLSWPSHLFFALAVQCGALWSPLHHVQTCLYLQLPGLDLQLSFLFQKLQVPFFGKLELGFLSLDPEELLLLKFCFF